MSQPSHNLLAKSFSDAVENHACPYAERVLRLDQRRNLGQYGLSAYELFGLEDQLNILHADGSCPPTHEDTSPTKAWSDWVRSTKR